MRTLILALFASLAACSPPAAEAPVETTTAMPTDTIMMSEPWARPSPGGVDLAAGYVTIMNRGGADDQLIGASSPRAARVELHTMNMEGAVMQMRPAESLPAPAGGVLALAPEGAHLMFIDIDAPFEPGQQIPVTLTFANAGQIDVTLEVRQPGAAPGPETTHSAH